VEANLNGDCWLTTLLKLVNRLQFNDFEFFASSRSGNGDLVADLAIQQRSANR
jgi:hypothetical protein